MMKHKDLIFLIKNSKKSESSNDNQSDQSELQIRKPLYSDSMKASMMGHKAWARGVILTVIVQWFPLSNLTHRSTSNSSWFKGDGDFTPDVAFALMTHWTSAATLLRYYCYPPENHLVKPRKFPRSERPTHRGVSCTKDSTFDTC